ncbi:MAG: hypothetical protein PHQ47_02180 [Candidatus Portnoybacteria bacterium]|nr:hypothetical protein [Candidatus Portnoybacteria bacterium]
MTLEERARLTLASFFSRESGGLEKMLFGELSEQIKKTATGGRLSDQGMSPEKFRTFEIHCEGKSLGFFHFLCFDGKTRFYYLVYLEVDEFFRENGLGGKAVKLFLELLEEKKAIGILVNIRKDNFYKEFGWEPARDILRYFNEEDDYMFFIPSSLKGKVKKKRFRRVIEKIKRKREAIGIRDNEANVRRTLEEFRRVYESLLIFFEEQIATGRRDELMEFLFTRFVLQFLRFRRRISKLVGFTDGASAMLELDGFARQMRPRFYLNSSRRQVIVQGDCSILDGLPDQFWENPADFIENLPNYPRLIFREPLRENTRPNLGDLADAGDDPTRLKAFGPFVIKRIHLDHLAEVANRVRILKCLEEANVNPRVRFNPPVCWIFSHENTYVFRRRIPAIHSYEIRYMFSADSMAEIRRAFFGAIDQARRDFADALGWEKAQADDYFTFFFECDEKTRYPKTLVFPTTIFPEAIYVS